MKILALILICVAMAGCEKCVECTSVMITKYSHTTTTSSPTTTTYRVCGRNDIKEAEGAITSTSEAGGYSVTVTSTTSCK